MKFTVFIIIIIIVEIIRIQIDKSKTYKNTKMKRQDFISYATNVQVRDWKENVHIFILIEA